MPTLNLTKLVTNQDTFGEMVEKINTNFDVISQAQGLRGEEGKRGVAGVPGPPGSIGPQGTQGAQGTNGNRWYFGEDFTDFNTSLTNIGDYFLEGLTGDIRERKVSGWELVGSVVGGSGGDSNIFNSFIPMVNNDTKIIKPIKTNYTLEITDISGTNPNYVVTPFSNNEDTANFVMGQTTDEQNWLQEMGLKIYTSESDDPLSSLYGRGKHIHLANSTGFIENKNIGWADQSGFTLTVDWDSVNTDLETLRIKNIKSVDSNHEQRIELESDRITLTADYVFSEAPLKLFGTPKGDVSSPELGTIIFDTDDNKFYGCNDNSPTNWIELGGGTTSGGGGFVYGKLFDDVGTEVASSIQTAGSPDNIFRLKAGNGIEIDPVNVNDPTSKRTWEIRLSSIGSPGVDDFGTVRVNYIDGNGDLQNKFSIASTNPGEILEIVEGDNINIENYSGKIKINSTGGTGTGSSSFNGFKYVFGQVGKGAFPGAGIFGQPLNTPFNELNGVRVNNDGSLGDMRGLEFTTPVPGFNNDYPFTLDTVNGSTTFTPSTSGYWQINVFAFGVIKMPNYGTEIPYYPGYTIVGGITKDNYDYSHISIAESSLINATALFGGLGFVDTSSYAWPTWTINCSDVIYLNDSLPNTFRVSVGGLYAPIDQNGTYIYGQPVPIDLYYCSGYVSGVYLGT